MSDHPRDEEAPPATDPEFPPGVDQPPLELDRRELMKLLAAGAALAGAGGLAGCMQPPAERIVPRVEQPPEMSPGVPLEYATSMVIDGYATGLVVKTLEARPIKVEGNPEHPASLGATSALHQASVLELYDPGRARGALYQGIPISLDALVARIARRPPIANLWFLLHPQSSPLVEELMARVRARHPGARFAFHAPLDRRAVHQGAELAFGRPLDPQYRFDRARVVVSLDADFLAAMPNSVRWSRDFAALRRVGWPIRDTSRLYVAEPRPTPTGSLADHRLPARCGELHAIAAALLAAVSPAQAAPPLPEAQRRWVRAAARDLLAARGSGLVVPGDRQPPAVHALVHRINDAIAAHGQTVAFTRPAIVEPLGDGLGELAAALRAGAVGMLVIAEANPVYSAPPELDLPGLLSTVAETLHLAYARDETSRHCREFVPLTHWMESWGDARAYDGTVSFVQPLIRPMASGLSLLELLAAFAGDDQPSGHRMLMARYAGAGDFAWRAALQRGFLPGSASPPEAVALRAGAGPLPPPPPAPGGLEVAFDGSHAVHDGRFAGIAWLQELPRPLDKLTWGNAAALSPRTAAELGVGDGDLIRIERDRAHVELPVLVAPGHADDAISLELGYGRWAGGPVADGVGASAYRIRPLAGPGFTSDVVARPTGGHQRLATTQEHWSMHGRPIALTAELERYRARPDFTEEQRGAQPSLLPDFFTSEPAWAMTIDTTICSGCSACVVACQAENNVPVVGREGVLDNREMHWLRIDTYREARAGQVSFVHQPMLCQHCEKAPCEYVCPVYATQHSPDGLNEMIYNRCIGTRFCSNNCPYKVRRFNWFDYTEDLPRTLQLQRNPSVTVRARGVMEKCTYCVQRIRAAEIRSRRERRAIRPGEVVTACQQACPTGAIQFGLLEHTGTEMVRRRREPRHYAVLHELGTRPRTVYLAKIENPSPLLR